jgi:hypothetical protein
LIANVKCCYVLFFVDTSEKNYCFWSNSQSIFYHVFRKSAKIAFLVFWGGMEEVELNGTTLLYFFLHIFIFNHSNVLRMFESNKLELDIFCYLQLLVVISEMLSGGA